MCRFLTQFHLCSIWTACDLEQSFKRVIIIASMISSVSRFLLMFAILSVFGILQGFSYLK